jgi:hypothetical protein
MDIYFRLLDLALAAVLVRIVTHQSLDEPQFALDSIFEFVQVFITHPGFIPPFSALVLCERGYTRPLIASSSVAACLMI